MTVTETQTDVLLTDVAESATMPDESKFKALLSEKLRESNERTMFTGAEVNNILLDLWLALNDDVKFEEQISEIAPVG